MANEESHRVPVPLQNQNCRKNPELEPRTNNGAEGISHHSVAMETPQRWVPGVAGLTFGGVDMTCRGAGSLSHGSAFISPPPSSGSVKVTLSLTQYMTLSGVQKQNRSQLC